MEAGGEIRTPPCVAVIGDLVGSRRLARRTSAQYHLEDLLDHFNSTYSDALLAPFTISRGDEFQALLRRADALPDIMWDASVRFQDAPLRFGVGHGPLRTRLTALPTTTDGPAWWNARDAFDEAGRSRRSGGVFVGFAADDTTLTAFGSVLQFMRDRLTERQRTVADLLRRGHDVAEVSRALGISKQALYRHQRAAGWPAYSDGEAGWRTMLRKYDFTQQWAADGE